jgi:hypothetical protein
MSPRPFLAAVVLAALPARALAGPSIGTIELSATADGKAIASARADAALHARAKLSTPIGAQLAAAGGDCRPGMGRITTTVSFDGATWQTFDGPHPEKPEWNGATARLTHDARPILSDAPIVVPDEAGWLHTSLALGLAALPDGEHRVDLELRAHCLGETEGRPVARGGLTLALDGAARAALLGRLRLATPELDDPRSAKQLAGPTGKKFGGKVIDLRFTDADWEIETDDAGRPVSRSIDAAAYLKKGKACKAVGFTVSQPRTGGGYGAPSFSFKEGDLTQGEYEAPCGIALAPPRS